MSEVRTPRYLAGLVPTHGCLRSRRLCQMPLNGGEAYPVRTWLSCYTYRHTKSVLASLCSCGQHSGGASFNGWTLDWC